MPGAITRDPAGDSRADVIALQEASSHCEGSEMIPLRMLITSFVFLDIHSVTFWAVLWAETYIEREDGDMSHCDIYAIPGSTL